VNTSAAPNNVRINDPLPAPLGVARPESSKGVPGVLHTPFEDSGRATQAFGSERKIGPIRLAHPITLAPMEEHTNYPFRLLMKQFGASLVCTERVDAVDVARRDRRAVRILYTRPQEASRAGQISGADPVVMAEAARVVEELGFDLVDLNFECPIRRLLNRGEGGALLANPPAIGRIVAAVIRAVSIPVTLKIRSGPDGNRETAVEVARLAEDAGAAAVDVHARSVAQAYVGGPDWSVVARVKRAVRIGVLGSGGVRQAEDALRFLRQTGADGVAIGRGCLGNPWIFRQARALVQNSGSIRPPSPRERGQVLVQLVEGEFRYYGAQVALRRLPRTSCYFAKFVPDFPAFRAAVHQVRDLNAFRRLVKEHFR
jgi:tRNA-dihydrouridine synthase B